MKDITYVLQNFFTHKDYLVPAAQIPGTLFTPLHFQFEALLVVFILVSAVHTARHREKIRPVLLGIWLAALIWEPIIIAWDSLAGMTPGLDLRVNLSLYPCSLYLYTMPLVLWGRGFPRQCALGYLGTLGLLGAVVNFLYPVSRLADYSCLSFAGFHTFFFHGAMLFTFLVLLLSGELGYGRAGSRWDLLSPAVPGLLLSIPANLVNYAIGADYMYFRGEFFLLARIFARTPAPAVTLILYVLYLVVPALFYFPGYLHSREEKEEPLSLPGLEWI